MPVVFWGYLNEKIRNVRLTWGVSSLTTIIEPPLQCWVKAECWWSQVHSQLTDNDLEANLNSACTLENAPGLSAMWLFYSRQVSPERVSWKQKVWQVWRQIQAYFCQTQNIISWVGDSSMYQQSDIEHWEAGCVCELDIDIKYLINIWWIRIWGTSMFRAGILEVEWMSALNYMCFLSVALAGLASFSWLAFYPQTTKGPFICHIHCPFTNEKCKIILKSPFTPTPTPHITEQWHSREIVPWIVVPMKCLLY